MEEEDMLDSVAHKMRLADYLVDGVWQMVDKNGNWTIHDREVEEDDRVYWYDMCYCRNS